MGKRILFITLIGMSFGIKAQLKVPENKIRFSEARGFDYDPSTNAVYYNDYNYGRVITFGHGGNLSTNSSIVSKMIKMDNGNTDLFMYRDRDVGDWSLLRTNKGNGIGLIGKPDQVALSVSRLTGNVGIRTTDTKGFELGVNGKIAANEVKVAIYPNWPDFVFDKEYNLPSLKEVENHIREKGHLKDIPSAKKVKKEGFFLGQMDSKLLQKIEELTLYTIQQQKEIEILKKEKKELNSINKSLIELQKRLEKLEKK